MAYKKQVWNNYNDSLSVEQNKANNALLTAEGLNHIETGIEQVEFSLNQQLAEMANSKFSMQADFVSQVSRLIGGYEKMYYKRENTPGWVTVMLRNKGEHVSWTFRNNVYDDFYILGDCFYGDVTTSPAIYQNKNYDSMTGTWATTAPNSHYTTQIGATFTTTVTGEKIEFRHYADTRGGIWEFVVDGDIENKVTISTYSATTFYPKPQTLFDNLPFREHVVVGTYKGDDPKNPPSSGAGTARGWVFLNGTNDTLTFRTYKTQLTNNRLQDLLVAFSIKEFAFRTRKSGSSHAYQFIPMHTGVGTAFEKVPVRFTADSATLSESDINNFKIGEFVECSRFTVTQSVYGRNPESGSENLVEINTNVTISKTGEVEVVGNMRPLTNIEIENGYGIMFPVVKGVTTRVISSIGNEYATTKIDGTKTILLEESDKTTSFMFTSSEKPDYVCSLRFNNPTETLKVGKEKTTDFLWLEHRDITMQKLYFRQFVNDTLTPTDIFKFSATFNCGKISGIDNLN